VHEWFLRGLADQGYIVVASAVEGPGKGVDASSEGCCAAQGQAVNVIQLFWSRARFNVFLTDIQYNLAVQVRSVLFYASVHRQNIVP
jgi:hypothetical protein